MSVTWMHENDSLHESKYLNLGEWFNPKTHLDMEIIGTPLDGKGPLQNREHKSHSSLNKDLQGFY